MEEKKINKLDEFVAKSIKKIRKMDPAALKEKIKALGASIKNVKLDLKNIKIDPKKIKKNYVWIALGLLVFMLVMAKTVGQIKSVITGVRAKKAKEMVEFAESVPVKVYKVRRMDFKDTLPAMGRIEGFREVDLRFEAAGVLESFNFEEGERVLEGDIIASLKQTDALLKLKYAGFEMEKAKKMFELGGYDKTAYEQKKLEHESAKRDLEKTNIYAPSDGYLGSRDKSPGSYVTPQDKVGTFVDYSQVYAVFDIIEEDAPKVKLGQNTEVYLDAYPGQTFAGAIDTVSPMIEGRTRTQRIKVELENKEDALKPGMFARAVINTYEKKDALVIPSSAFKKKEEKYFVYVVHKEETEAEKKGKAEKKKKKKKEKDKDKKVKEEAAPPEEEPAAQFGTVEEREIRLGYTTYDMAEVAKGVEEGELVVREVHQEFKDKDRVEITEEQETIF